ncbi:MAG: sulfide:quinone reductase [Gammaproteobacteria bacterium]|nr:MAG: sulfide:quinone reductase [Gammaproteobacteria bacterium]
MEKVLVLGGGIGGVETAIALADKGFDVELISDKDYLWIHPISIWIPTGEISPEGCQIPLKLIAERNDFKFTLGKVKKILSKERKVLIETEKGEEEKTYDRLVVAIGGVKKKHKGLEHTFSTCGGKGELLRLRERYYSLIEKGKGTIAFGFGGNPADPSGVRGGPVFEVLFNIHYHLKGLGLRDKFRLVFFAPMPKPGKRLGEKNADKVFDFFKKIGVDYKVGVKIKEFQPDGILFEDGEKIESDLTIFTPALDGHPVLKESDLPLNQAGFIKIDQYCAVEGSDYTVWAVGDCASIEGPDWKAKQGHLAEVMGRIVARNIEMVSKGELQKLESYLPHVHIVCLMDMGPWGGILFARTHKRTLMIPLPKVGHWLKKLWAWYYKNSKLRRIPRIPGFDAP